MNSKDVEEAVEDSFQVLRWDLPVWTEENHRTCQDSRRGSRNSKRTGPARRAETLTPSQLSGSECAEKTVCIIAILCLLTCCE
jgi:hypothetical protein